MRPFVDRPAPSRSRWRAAPLGACALAAALTALAACSDGGPARVAVYELGENLAFASSTRETDEIDIGAAGDEPHLRAGWSYREHESRSGRTFRWGLEPHSELAFTVHEPREVTLELEIRPRRTSAAAPAVELEVNGRPAGRLELGPDPKSYELPLGAELLRRGENLLRVRYELGGRPTMPPDDDRRLTVAYYRLGLAGLGRAAAEPRLDAERDLLFIPYGAELDYYLRAPAGALLRSDRRRFVAGEGRLVVHLDEDGSPERRLAAVGDEGRLEVPLDAPADQAIRLSLAALAAGPGGEGAGVALEAPVIWAEPAPESAEAAPVAASGEGRRPNLVVYLVDTLRADHLGCYGHDRDVSPRIDEFASRATLFENARANAPWTLPAVASVMTGLWPPAHGVFEDTRRLVDEAVTLAEVLRDAGYQTGAIVTNGFATDAYGLEQGFEELTLITRERRKSSHVNEEALAWLERRDPERPFFLYLHTIDPHKPYLPADELRERFAPDADDVWRQIVANPAKQRWPPNDYVINQLRALYDAEIAENDASFGDALDALEAAGLYDDALIVFLSDHGEEFYEHGAWTHASDLFREVLNVPLIVKLPGQREGRRVAELAQQIDLMPTLLAYLGIDGPPMEGRELPALLELAGAASGPVFSHTRRNSQTTASVIDGDWKLIRRVDERGVTTRLFNWREDPRELTDLAAERPVLAGLLTVALQRQIAESRPPGVGDAAPDEDVLDNLRDLGYID